MLSAWKFGAGASHTRIQCLSFPFPSADLGRRVYCPGDSVYAILPEKERECNFFLRMDTADACFYFAKQRRRVRIPVIVHDILQMWTFEHVGTVWKAYSLFIVHMITSVVMSHQPPL